MLPKCLQLLGPRNDQDLRYSYDARGNVVDIDDAVVPSRNRSMTYDDLGRLETAQGAWGSGSFNYDALGNLLEKQLGSRTVTVSYDAATNRATQSADTAGSTHAIGYDSRGNVTTLGALSFVYDMANQPVQVAGSSTGNYTYDGNFKRVKAVVDGKTIYNVYDASGSLVHIDDVTGSVAKSTDYIRVNGMTIARLENGEPTYLSLDLLGSPVAATDARGIVTWQEHYTPYGEKWQQAAANDNQMGFTGHIADTATGLTYMQARYYDPVIGRFLSNDPVEFAPSRPGYFNRYAYVLNNPFNKIDPTGEGHRNLHNIAKLVARTEKRVRQLNKNKQKGKEGEAKTREKLGEDVAGEQVTFKTSDGTRTRTDFVTKDKKVVETKTGDAKLSTGQEKLKNDVDSGKDVTPVGKNAEKAGLEPNKPTKMSGCSVDRPC